MADNPTPAPVALRRYGGWEQDKKDRAKALYLGPANMSAHAVEWMLVQEAQQEAPDGDDPLPVPAARTIREWSQTEGWDAQRYAHLAEHIGAMAVRIDVKMATNVEAAADTYSDILLTTKYDANPAAGMMKQKAADAVLKVWGKGTYGANQGGEIKLRIEQLLPPEALDDLHASETPMETERRLREETIEEKRGGH